MVDDLIRWIGAVSQPPRRVARLVRFFIGERARIMASYRYISDSPEHVSLVLEDARAEAGRIAAAEGRVGMVQELVAGFVDASERRRNEDRWGEIYAAEAVDESDDFAEASALEAGSRWHTAP